MKLVDINRNITSKNLVKNILIATTIATSTIIGSANIKNSINNKSDEFIKNNKIELNDNKKESKFNSLIDNTIANPIPIYSAFTAQLLGLLGLMSLPQKEENENNNSINQKEIPC